MNEISITLTDDQWSVIETALDDIGTLECDEIRDVIRLRGLRNTTDEVSGLVSWPYRLIYSTSRSGS